MPWTPFSLDAGLGAGTLERNGVAADGLSVSLGADGALEWRADRLTAHDLAWQIGPARAQLASAELRGVRAVARLPQAGTPLQLRQLSAEALEVEGLTLEAGAAPRPGAATAVDWRLDALGGLEGRLRAFITDAAWIVDADITVPVREGRIHFDEVTVEHFGPNSSLGLSAGGLYVDTPNLGRRYLYVFTGGDVPGARFEQRGGAGEGVTDRGQLDLGVFVQGLLQADQAPPGQPAGPHIVETLNRTRLSGELHLGDGALGSAQRHLVLAGQAHGRNRISLMAGAAGEKLVLALPEFTASHARFTGLGMPGGCDTVAADMSLEIDGLARQPRLQLVLRRLSLSGLAFGAAAG